MKGNKKENYIQENDNKIYFSEDEIFDTLLKQKGIGKNKKNQW